MLHSFSKVSMAHIPFTAVINKGGIGKGISGIRKGTKKNYIYFCNLLREEKRKPKPWSPNEFSHLASKRIARIFQHQFPFSILMLIFLPFSYTLTYFKPKLHSMIICKYLKNINLFCHFICRDTPQYQQLLLF